MVNLVLSEEGTKFKVGAIAHPAMLDPKDAEKVQKPLMVLASKDEEAKDVKQFEENLKVEKHVETFGDQIHGVSASIVLQEGLSEVIWVLTCYSGWLLVRICRMRRSRRSMSVVISSSWSLSASTCEC